MTAAAGLAAFAAARVFGGFIADAQESARVSRLTAAAIKSTGGAAHVTAKQVDAMASRIMKLTGIDDETIKSGENMLLTFRNIRDETGKGNAIFDRATSILTDMTAALHGGDVSAEGMRKQAIQLGKALNDPIKGMSALSRVGVTFTQKQKDQVAALVASGDALDAQKLILRELGKEFGGTAKAAADPMKRLKASLGEVGEAIGGKLLGPLNTAVTFIQFKAMPLVGKWAARWGHDAAGISHSVLVKLKPLTDFLHGLISGPAPVIPLPKLAGHVPVTPGPKFQVPLPQLPGHVPVMQIPGTEPAKMAASLAGRLTAALKSIKWGEIIGKVISGAVAQAPKIGAALSDLIGKVDWADAGKKAAFAIVPFAIGLVSNLTTALISEAVHHPLDMLTFIASLIPIGRAAGIIVKVFGKIPFLGPLLKLFLGPMEKAGSFIEKGLGKLLRLVFGPVLKRIEPFFSGAVGWLRGKGESILLGLWYGAQRIWGKITGWLGRIFGWVLRPFGRAASWLLSKGGDIISGLWSGIRNIWPKITGWLGSVGGWVKGKFASAATWLVKAGGSIVHGLLTGIRNYMAGIGSWIKGNIVDPVISAVKHFFGISSPSTVMASIGGHLVSGLIRGMLRANPVAMVTRVFGSMPKALGALVGKGLVDIAKLPGRALHALGGLGGWLGHLFGFGGGGSGVGRWAGTAAEALKLLRLPPGYLPLVLAQMGSESGGNPTIVNRSDSNWLAGHPSVGLMQVIAGTFARWAGPFRNTGPFEYGVSVNPLANIFAALNYAKHGRGFGTGPGQIGSLHGYARGGLITEPVFGIGRSGRPYTFGEKGTERVTPGTGPAGDRELLEAVRQLTDVAQRSPGMTAALIADALNSVGRRSAHAAAWSGGSW